MADEGITTGTEQTTAGQADDPTKGDFTPAGTAGQPEGVKTETTEGAGTQPVAEETFFDPESIKDKPELMAGYKQMQKAFSKKTQAIKDIQRKAEAYDQFNSNPVQYMQQLAQQMGYSLAPANKQQTQDEEYEPQTWNDVFTKAKQDAVSEVMKELQPFIGSIKDMRKQSVEKFLDDNATDWRQYESEMMDKLKEHPSLVNDPLALYTLALPKEVLESRAYQKWAKKMESKAKSAGTSGISTTKRSETTTAEPRNFNEAVQLAKKQMAEKAA